MLKKLFRNLIMKHKKMIVNAEKIKLHISFILIWHEKEIYSKRVKQIYEKRALFYSEYLGN
jgi:hypothetical protein